MFSYYGKQISEYLFLSSWKGLFAIKTDINQLFIFLSNVVKEKELHSIVLKLKSKAFQNDPQILLYNQ